MSKVTLRDLLMGGPGHDGYAYQADTYCVQCGQDIIRRLWDEKRLPQTMDECSDTEVCPQPIFFGEDPDRTVHCAHCGEYLYGTDPEAEPEEPEEGDYTTEDDASCSRMEFYQYGKLVLTVNPDLEDWKKAVKRHMDENQFWPNVWFCSDHGNWWLLSLS